jgi:hypothetical protein
MPHGSLCARRTINTIKIDRASCAITWAPNTNHTWAPVIRTPVMPCGGLVGEACFRQNLADPYVLPFYACLGVLRIRGDSYLALATRVSAVAAVLKKKILGVQVRQSTPTRPGPAACARSSVAVGSRRVH